MDFEAIPLEAITALAEPEPAKEEEFRDTNAVTIYKMCVDDLGVIPFRGEDTGSIYARFPMSAHIKITGLRSEEFKAWLTRKFFMAKKKEPSQSDIDGALRLMEAEAWERPKRKLFIRLARVEGKIYLDLCNNEYQAVEVDEAGWRIVENPPAWFIRSSSMKPLPIPQSGGCLSQLREILHLPDEDFVILCGWLVAACNPEGPFPLLAVSAEAGSGKSFLTEVLKRILDDDISPKLAPFRDVDSIFAAAASHWMLAYDNLTKLTTEDSDHLCRIATGAGYAKRKLYTDNDEYSTSAARPVLLNGITVPVTRMDLTDRSYFVRLPHIPPEKRRTERSLWRQFEEMRPQLLGALMTAVSCALRESDYVPDNPPRMADAAEFTLQAEKGGGLPWPVGTFSAVLARMEAQKKEEAIAEDAVASTLLELSENGGWSGSLNELLGHVHQGRTPEEIRFLPGTPQILSRRIEEVKPFLRAQGVTVEKKRMGPGHRVIVAKVPDVKPQDFNAVECHISTQAISKLHRPKADEHRESVGCVACVGLNPISSLRGKKKSGYPGFKSEVFEEVIPCESQKKPTQPTQATQIQQSQGFAECRLNVACVEGVTTVSTEQLQSVNMVAWLEEQSEEVKVYHSEQLRRISIIGVADPEGRALQLAWDFSKSMNEGSEVNND